MIRGLAVLVLAVLVLCGSCAHAPPPRAVPLFTGIGTHTRAVTTINKEAQRYFDQGLAFLFAFNHDEAIRAFSTAATLDPDCAMAHWGVALANGPHINNPAMDPEHVRAAWAALARAQTATHASEVERALIHALNARYVDLPTAEVMPEGRAHLDRAYADAMRAVWQAHPRDTDVGALFAEALMDLRPWDLWTPDGQPQPETPEILATLEKVLSIDALHPLGNHLYIHAVEASPHPEKADAAADRLRDLEPALGHLVHMPSHIDVRRGRWLAAEHANQKAIEADGRYRERVPQQGFYRMYMLHNRHMLAWAALMRGQSALAMRAIREAVDSIPPEWLRQNAALVDGFMAMPLEVLMRFGRWDEILAAPEFAEDLPIARTLRHSARGIALAAKGDLAGAKNEQQTFAAARARVPAEATYGNNSAADLLTVAARLLDGEIAVHDGQMATGLVSLRAAAAAEDALRYDEPPDWIQPARHALGAALLKAGHPDDAEAVYREDLRRLPENGWSLRGLAQSLTLQKKDAAPVEKQLAHTWVDADIQIPSSCLCLP
jgi:tetratricopeptide (TPR) repeat protein